MNENTDMLIKEITNELIKFDIKEKEPPLYKVLIINDPVTPMIFVVNVLMTIFHKDRASADKIMITAHKTGSCICGVYPFEVAEMQVKRVKDTAQKDGYPLNCVMKSE